MKSAKCFEQQSALTQRGDNIFLLFLTSAYYYKDFGLLFYFFRYLRQQMSVSHEVGTELPPKSFKLELVQCTYSLRRLVIVWSYI